MRDRNERLRAIRAVVRAEKVDSQELLLRLLAERGFSLTQATLSRDLKLLKVAKTPDGDGGYLYTLPSDEELRVTEEENVKDFRRGYVSIDWNATTVVVRTFSGHSDAVSLALDNMGLEGVLGTIAGRDNVVFVALREGFSGADFVASLKRRVPDFEGD